MFMHRIAPTNCDQSVKSMVRDTEGLSSPPRNAHPYADPYVHREIMYAGWVMARGVGHVSGLHVCTQLRHATQACTRSLDPLFLRVTQGCVGSV